MIYQLVLITNLGVMTPLATFPDRIECMKEQAFIQKSPQYSAACLPAEDPKQAQARIEQGMKMMNELMNSMKEQVK